MKEQNIQKAITFLRKCLQDIVDEKCPMENNYYQITYGSVTRTHIRLGAYALADRITARDPGNKPSSGDRIPFVYIHNKKTTALQGEKIETPSYITENNLKIDYSFYISNQLMKPIQQVFALVLEKIWKDQNKLIKIKKFKDEIKKLEKTCEQDKFETKLEQLKNKEVKALLFDEYLRVTNNTKSGMNEITNFFGKK